MKECFACDLAMKRNKIVYGKGNKDANIMILLGSPDYYEDKYGEPCMGKGGIMLTRFLSYLNIDYSNTYFTNIIKCKTIGVIKPSKVELSTCTKLFLKRELAIIKPKFIITIGFDNTNMFLNNNLPISKQINNIYKIGDMYILPAFDPNYIIKENKEFEYSKQLKVILTLINKHV